MNLPLPSECVLCTESRFVVKELVSVLPLGNRCLNASHLSSKWSVQLDLG